MVNCLYVFQYRFFYSELVSAFCTINTCIFKHIIQYIQNFLGLLYPFPVVKVPHGSQSHAQDQVVTSPCGSSMSFVITDPFEEAQKLFSSTLEQEQQDDQPPDWKTDQNSSLPLYDGCPVSVLQAHAGLLHWYATHGTLSQTDFDRLLALISKILPSGHRLAASYDEALKVLQPYIIDPVTYHCCPNDCCIYRNTSSYR